WASRSFLASASWIFTGGRWYAVVRSPESIRNDRPGLPRHTDRAGPFEPRHLPRGVMQRDLVERARRGDHDAFAGRASAAISRLDSAAWLILRDPDRAKDAVQNALVRAWRDLPTLRDSDHFDQWLHRLLVRACIDEARRLRRHR